MPGVEMENAEAVPSLRPSQDGGEQRPWYATGGYMPQDGPMPQAEEPPRRNWDIPRRDEPQSRAGAVPGSDQPSGHQGAVPGSGEPSRQQGDVPRTGEPSVHEGSGPRTQVPPRTSTPQGNADNSQDFSRQQGVPNSRPGAGVPEEYTIHSGANSEGARDERGARRDEREARRPNVPGAEAQDEAQVGDGRTRPSRTESYR